MSRYSSLFLLFCFFQLKSADISLSIKKNSSVLSKKYNFTRDDLYGSISYQILKLIPELGLIIIKTFLELNNEQINNTKGEKITVSLALKSCCRKQLYQYMIQSSKLTHFTHFKYPQFKDIHLADSEQLETLDFIVHGADKDTTKLCCLNYSGRSAPVISEKNYQKIERAARSLDLDTETAEVTCCYDWFEMNNTFRSLTLISASCLLPFPLCVCSWASCLTSWGLCYVHSGGFRQVHGFHPKNS